jgi:NhaP-type Na+/H+ or K+/H+ antiporter
MTWLAFIAALIAIPAFAGSRLAARAAAAPGLAIAAGAGIALLLGLFKASIPVEIVAAVAKAALAALAFASAAQLRVSRLARRCPSSFRLTFGGAPIYLLACSLAAFIMIPSLSGPTAALVGATLMLNGAAFDRRAVTRAPAPAAIKAAVRYESAATIALGLPLAVLVAANATAPSPEERMLGPLLAASISVLKGFAFGGVLGLLAAWAGRWYRRRTMQARALDGQFAMLAGALAFALSPLFGAEALVAAAAAGLVWGEETDSAATTRLRLRRYSDRAIAPLAYFGFGLALAPRLLQADMLAIVFALAAVTIMRAGPRLAILQTPALTQECQMFLAWFGGAPGAASALFIMTLLGNPALYDADAAIMVSSLAVLFGVAAARLTSRPLTQHFLRQSARARRQRRFAG